jgi:hypothetical protein
MVQTDLKSDNFCGYNTSAATFFWVSDPVQNNLQFNAGETGVFTGVGLHTPSEVIDVSSMIVAGGRDNYLTSCVPPVPPLPSKKGFETDESIRGIGQKLPTQGLDDRGTDLQMSQSAQFNRENNERFVNMQNDNKKVDYLDLVEKADGTRARLTDRTQFLLPEVTNHKRSATDYSDVDWQAGFSGNANNLYTVPQLLTNVIERMALERGGLDQNQIIKQSQEPWTKNTLESGPRGPVDLNGKEQIPTCQKIRQPYNIKFPFGLPTNPNNGEELKERESIHFNSIDVASLGNNSPVLDQDPSVQFNYNGIYSNGGCNKVSFLKDINHKMCSDSNNDLTGIDSFNFSTDMPPSGISPIRSF